MRLVIHADFTANQATSHTERHKGFFHHIVMLGQAAECDIHILIRLAKHVHASLIMAVILIKVDRLGRERLKETAIILDTSLINDDFTTKDHIMADIFLRIKLIGSRDGYIRPYGESTTKRERTNKPLQKAAIWPTPDSLNNPGFPITLLRQPSGEGSLARAGNTEIDIEDVRYLAGHRTHGIKEEEQD